MRSARRRRPRYFSPVTSARGKSTQLRRFAVEPSTQALFSVVLVRLETTELPFLDVAQLLFHMARGLYEHGRSLSMLGGDQPWRKHLEALDKALYGADGLTVTEGTTAIEVDLLVVKLRQDLRASQGRRQKLREFGESQRSVLIRLLDELSVAIEKALHEAGKPSTLLMVLDDLDKVRAPEQQKDLFQTNLGALFEPRFRVVYTLPAAVSFDPTRRELLQAVEHLYPERVLAKAPASFEPEQAFLDSALPFFKEALEKRVDPSLVDEAAVRLATAYSGGVVRDYFRLLKEASAIAEQLGQTRLDAAAVRGAIREERLRWTRSLTHDDYKALLTVHRTHDRGEDEQYRRLLDLGLLLECYNDDTWYEAHPLLWGSLERRARDDAG